MADIRSYMKEKEKRERRQEKQQKQQSYKEKIRKHKLAAVYRILLVLAALVALVALIIVQYKRHLYTDYDIVASVNRETVSGTRDMRLGSSVLTYSRDGAHCTDSKGVVNWNQTYGIQDVKLTVCGSTVAVGEYNGRSIYVANSEKLLGEITTTMPIRNLAVSVSGNVTAVLADTDVTWVNTYDCNGNLLYKGQTHMNNSGYPAAIALSPNGELLCVSYIYVDAGVVKTDVAFYNLGPVGANYSDYFVSVYTYRDMLVPYVQFINDETAFAVGDSRLMIYSGGHVPETKREDLYDEEVKSVFYNERYIGLVFASDDSEHLYKLVIYDTAANAENVKVGKYYFDIEYTDIFFGKDNFVIYNESECLIKTMGGVEKYSGTFSKAVRLMLPAGNTYRYLLVTDSSIDTIQLK